jgi:type IX secretion system PorP/SprF family membrane protein
MKKYNKTTLKGLMMFTIITLIGFSSAKAQLSPFGAMYFQNQYLGNPSLAGAEEGFRMDLGYNSQQTTMPGSPKTQAITMGYRVKKVGMGLNVTMDQAGLISRTRVMGTYAYHLTLDNDLGFLRFGLSMGLGKDRISGDIIGDATDVSIARYNQRAAYLDGDFGLTYEKKALTLQFAVPNLNTFFRSDVANASNVLDRSKFFGAISYKVALAKTAGGIGLEPKIVYRKNEIGYKAYIIDLGTNVTLLNERASFMAMYHSTNSVSLGLGSKVTDKFSINAFYTTGTAAYDGNTNGDFEIHLRMNLSKNAK